MKTLQSIFITSFFLLMILAVPEYATAADVAKIGVVSLQKIFETSDAGKDAQAEYTKQGMRMQEDLKKKADELEELQKKYENSALVMSKEQREELEREYRIKQGDFKATEKKHYADMKEINAKILQKMQGEVSEIINQLGKKDGYLLIIEKSVALYSPTTIDVTDQVVQMYNAEYAKNKKQ